MCPLLLEPKPQLTSSGSHKGILAKKEVVLRSEDQRDLGRKKHGKLTLLGASALLHPNVRPDVSFRNWGD